MNLPPKSLKQQIANRNAAPSAAEPEPLVQETEPLKPVDSIPRPAPKMKPITPSAFTQQKPAPATPLGVQKQPESLPVLTAFQEFLEVERSRMRRRLVALSACYLVALIFIVSASFIAGMTALKRFRADVDNLQTELTRLQQVSIKYQTDTDTLAQRLSTETVRLRTDMQTTDDEKNKLLSQVSQQNNKLSKIDELIKNLQNENTLLRNNLTVMQTKWMALTNDLVASLSQAIRPPEVSLPAQPNNSAAAAQGLVMSITPRGSSRSTEWRLPIPE